MRNFGIHWLCLQCKKYRSLCSPKPEQTCNGEHETPHETTLVCGDYERQEK
jgi:hypothetical protein